MTDKIYKLSPSDFAYIYKECKLCYYMKIKDGMYRPSSPFPGVFSAINSRIQDNLLGRNIQTILKDLPEAKVESQEEMLASKVVPGTSIYLSGKYDLLLDNGDGTHTVVDLKLSQPSDEKAETYGSQLHAYKYMLEHPQSGEPRKVSKLALLIFYPDKTYLWKEMISLSFPHKWIEVEIDDKKFMKLVKDIDKLIKGPAPEATSNCQWCKYRRLNK